MPTTDLQRDAKARWEQFCEELKKAGDQLVRDDLPLSELDAAEGLRYLSRLVRTGLERNVEGADPAHPFLHVLCNERIKGFGGDNPDTLYYGAALSDDHEYTLVGDFSRCSYFSVVATGQEEDLSSCVTGSIDSDSLPTAARGPVKILLRATQDVEEEGANVCSVNLDGRTQSLLVRCTFDDVREKRVELALDRIDSSGELVQCEFSQVTRDLLETAEFVCSSAQRWCDRSAGMRPGVNELPLQDPERMRAMGGDPNIFYYNTAWSLAEDESWEIDLPKIPECTTWGFQTNNLWTESLDYTQAKIHLNKSTAHYEEDGSVKIIVSERDPGHPNWLRTLGHRTGTANLRIMGAREPVQTSTRIVKRGD